eukprot:TRINITY_DN66516_c0_g1_i1.p1 TRINITY_DN66516_c0_g1~~TRINITY_DN66516_c0_g1_i1.p1  ORF type:complete len:294 (+),score=56.95 TRINITY_DN66516_c0_g1_i1:37-882(+)
MKKGNKKFSGSQLLRFALIYSLINEFELSSQLINIAKNQIRKSESPIERENCVLVEAMACNNAGRTEEAINLLEQITSHEKEFTPYARNEASKLSKKVHQIQENHAKYSPPGAPPREKYRFEFQPLTKIGVHNYLSYPFLELCRSSGHVSKYCEEKKLKSISSHTDVLDSISINYETIQEGFDEGTAQKFVKFEGEKKGLKSDFKFSASEISISENEKIKQLLQKLEIIDKYSNKHLAEVKIKFCLKGTRILIEKLIEYQGKQLKSIDEKYPGSILSLIHI